MFSATLAAGFGSMRYATRRVGRSEPGVVYIKGSPEQMNPCRSKGKNRRECMCVLPMGRFDASFVYWYTRLGKISHDWAGFFYVYRSRRSHSTVGSWFMRWAAIKSSKLGVAPARLPRL